MTRSEEGKPGGIFDRLRGGDWFNLCAEQTLRLWESHGRLRRLQNGEFVSFRGEEVHSLWILLAGTLEVSIAGLDGRRHVLGFVGEGQMVNLIPVLDDQVAIHNICSHGASEVLLIPKDVFQTSVSQDSGLSRYIMRLLCLRSRMFYDRLADVSLLPVRTRCARSVLSLLPSGFDPDSGEPCTIRISQNELADMVGASRQTVNQELKKLQENGVLDIGYSQITVRDVHYLSNII